MSSTRLIEMQLSPQNQEKSFDEEFLLINKSSLKDISQEYENVAELGFNTYAYLPSELNAIILEIYKKKYILLEKCTHPTFEKIIYHVFKNQNQTVILFNVVTDSDKRIQNLPFLDEALAFYHSQQNRDPDALIVVPIAEIIRRHFRLLTINKDKIHYYDSKNSIICQGSRIFVPFVPAVNAAIEEMSNHPQAQMDANAGYLQLFKTMTILLGSLAYQTIIHYPTFLDPVKQTCKKYFGENVSFYHCAMSHQAYHEHTDCGPYTASYAHLVADGQSPDALNKDIITVRHDLYGPDEKPLSTPLNTADEKAQPEYNAIPLRPF